MSGDWGFGSPESGGSESVSIGESDPSESTDGSILSEEKSTQRPLTSDESKSDLSSASLLRKGEYSFLPVLGFNEAQATVRRYLENGSLEGVKKSDDDVLKFSGKELTWWEDASIIPKHPFMLVNPLEISGIDPDLHSFRDVFRAKKGDVFVFSDSGGYQLVTLDEAEIVGDEADHSFSDMRVHPETLTEWQVENADAGSTIDFPPYVSTGDTSFFDSVNSITDTMMTEDGEMPWDEFFSIRADEAADMAYLQARRLKEMRDAGIPEAEDYIFAPVIQGRPHPDDPHKYVRRWHEAMVKTSLMMDVKPRGWTCSPKPANSPGQIALFLGYAAEELQDADFIHVLMVGGIVQKALIMYYAKHVDQMVTSDASSHTAGGKRRQMYLPETGTRRSVIISSRDESMENAEKEPNTLNRYPCRCPVCAVVDEDQGFDFIKNGSGNTQSATLNLHNLQQALSVERTIDALIREEDAIIVETGGEPTGCEFWRYMRGLTNEKRIKDLYRAMDYVRIALEDGLQAANNEYRIKWDSENRKTIDRGVDSAAGVEW